MEMKTVEMNIEEAKRGMELERQQHEQKMKEFQKQLDEANQHKALLLADFNVERIEVAKTILEIRSGGEYFDRTCVEDAIQDILADTEKMKERYFGSKNYAHWRNQRSDHPYFYGPSHGTIVCSIGLKHEFRKGLTDEQKEDCLYYLNLLLDKEKRSQLLAS